MNTLVYTNMKTRSDPTYYLSLLSDAIAETVAYCDSIDDGYHEWSEWKFEIIRIPRCYLTPGESRALGIAEWNSCEKFRTIKVMYIRHYHPQEDYDGGKYYHPTWDPVLLMGKHVPTSIRNGTRIAHSLYRAVLAHATNPLREVVYA